MNKVTRRDIPKRPIPLPVVSAIRYPHATPMRLPRLLFVGLALVLLIAVLVVDGGSAYAQDVGDTEQNAADAAERSDVAAGLVDAAVANRAEIEVHLAATFTRISDLAAQLSTVAAGLDKVEGQIVFADAEMTSIEAEIEAQAVDAYMNALAVPMLSFVNSDTVESALVVGVVVEAVISGRQAIEHLVAKKNELETLQADYLTKQDEVADLKAEVDLEVAKLAALYDQADAKVAYAIRKANTADAEYRSALSAVDSARAREAEQKRQDERTTTTATNPSSSPPTTTSPPPTSPPTTSGGGSGGSWTGKPGVEQWRGVVSQYFPAHRVDEALQIMQCESLGDPNAYNPYSGASGLYQFLPATWATTAPMAGFPDVSAFEPAANIATAAWLANRYEQLGQNYWQPWSCRQVLN